MRQLGEDDAGALHAFFAALPAEDRTFFWQDVTDPRVAREWMADTRRISMGAAGEDGRLVAFAALVPGSDWTSHVVEVVLVVAPEARRGGMGRRLAQGMLLEAVRREFRKVTVHIAADNTAAIAMFQGIGFQAEALLRDHLLSPEDGALRDLMILAHLVDERYATMLAAGLDEVGT